VRFESRLAPAFLGALLVGCSGAGSTATQPASALPAGASGKSVALSPRSTRRTQDLSECSGVGAYSFVGGTDGNVAAVQDAAVAGGLSNYACAEQSFVGGGDNNVITSNGSTSVAGFIGGGFKNVLIQSPEGAIAGGADNELNGGGTSFIGGGQYNIISDAYAVAAGGYENNVSAEYAAIAGGELNIASAIGTYVGGGGYNTASGEGAIVDGGFNSIASGTFATVPGGYVNNAAGTYSFAAGARASAAQTGTFVWSDGSDGDTILTSSRAYQFLARASGGVTFWTNAASTVGATLAPGSGTWASASDRNLKTDVANVDDAAVLEKVAALPISRWSYKSERGVRHLGPMAQDFYAAFRVGEDDKHITSIDEDGVALTAIKALHTDNLTLHAANDRLRADDRAVHAQLADLRLQVAALRKLVIQNTAK
jgi:hypothetical protein